MSKQSALARRRAAQEEKRRSRQRRIWGIGVGAAVMVVAAVIFTAVYFTVLKDDPPATAEPITEPITELIIEDQVEGTGAQAQSGDTLSVYYTGWLYDGGTEFDTNVRDDPLKFTLGATPRQVIKGWDQGLAGMKVGGTRKLTIPPDLAYGAAGYGSKIPPNAALVFEVQLQSIE